MSSYLSSQAIYGLLIATALWSGIASAKQPTKLGYAETVIGGDVILIEESCIFQGLGAGYSLYLTNPRGTTIGKGCALTNALPPELGMIMVQWGASPVHGAENYEIDAFTWTPRGRVVLAPVLKARYDSKVRIKMKEASEAKDESENAELIASYNRNEVVKKYLGATKNKTDRVRIIILPKPCNFEVITQRDGQNVLEWNQNGRSVLSLYSDNTSVFEKGCALANVDGSITVKFDYRYNRPELFMANQISWESKGQEWFNESAKGD